MNGMGPISSSGMGGLNPAGVQNLFRNGGPTPRSDSSVMTPGFGGGPTLSGTGTPGLIGPPVPGGGPIPPNYGGGPEPATIPRSDTDMTDIRRNRYQNNRFRNGSDLE